MTGSNVAEQLPKTHVRVVVHSDFTFAATESELRKIGSRLCARCDVQVRGILGSGKRDVREIETLGRSLRWTEEASDKHRQVLLEGLGLSAESKAASAGVKPEETGKKRARTLVEAERKKFRSLAATLNHMRLDGSILCFLWG